MRSGSANAAPGVFLAPAERWVDDARGHVVGIVVLAVATLAARSVALAGLGLGLGLDSVIVLRELSGTGAARECRALRMIGLAFVALAIYLTVQCAVVLATGFRQHHSTSGIAWTPSPLR